MLGALIETFLPTFLKLLLGPLRHALFQRHLLPRAVRARSRAAEPGRRAEPGEPRHGAGYYRLTRDRPVRPLGCSRVSEPRIIKKYPNRRLYDTEVSRYVTLEDVRSLVLQEIPFQVRDARTNEDLTRSILLQIIMEQEADGEPMFSEQVLAKIIRHYGDSLQGMMASYLERSLNLFFEQQSRVQDQMKTMMGSDPLSMMREITERNLSIWQEMQEGLLRAATTPPPGGIGASRPRDPAPRDDD